MQRIFGFIILCVFAAVNVSAMSVDVGENKLDVYASIRTTLYYTDISGSDSYRDMTSVKMGMQSNSRIGVKWGWENMSAQAELGLGSPTDATLRLLFADYKFADSMGTIRMGQFASVADTQTVYSRRADTDGALAGVGSIAQVRRPGVSYMIKDFTIQLTSLSNDASIYTGLIAPAGYTDVRFKEMLPKIELLYASSDIPVKVFGAYALFQADGMEAANEKNFSASAYHVGLLVSPKFGDFYGSVAGYYSVNGGLYGMIKTGNGSGGTANVLPSVKANGDIEDVRTYGGAINLGYKLSPTMTAEVGAGYQLSSCDTYIKDDYGMGIYGNITIKPNKWIMITPEISYIDYMSRPNGTDDAKLLQVGAQFRVDI